jgi:VacB/RNase II family 3'-5' exoribonuclease
MSQIPPAFDFYKKARSEMIREKFQPDFPAQVMAEVNAVHPPPTGVNSDCCRELRALLWSSIDNRESRDLDQIEWAERMPDGRIRVLVGVADVDATVKKASATDSHAGANATSVYTGGPVFPMLPERLSTDLTSLGPNADRPAIIVEFVVDPGGAVVCADACTALVRNQAQLNYDDVGRWLGEGSGAPCSGPVPEGLEDQLHLQNEAAGRLQRFRKENGALTFGGAESIPILVNNQVTGFAMLKDNAARNIIESFMVAANVAMARFLRAKNSLCVRRIVRTPKRWDRIQAIAAAAGTNLPQKPDARALGEFLAARKQADPDHFPELSLSILKSMGPGEYVVEHPGNEHEGHFGLAVSDYTHSTAPNRRYADLLMQRLLKAAILQNPAPYSEAELTTLAAHCTERESAARHVERFMKKVAAALLLAPQIGKTFDAIVTGVSSNGTFARLLTVPAEGRIMRGEKGLDIGQKTRVRLIAADANLGFIDLESVH